MEDAKLLMPNSEEHWNVNRKIFLFASAVVITGYFALWLMNFRYVYGWYMDDLYYFDRGTGIVDNPINLFKIWNYTHLNHLIFGTLPVLFDYNIPSLPLPNLESRTGLFWGFLLFSILLHGALIAIWVVTLDRIGLNRFIALSALLLFVTGPTLMFWAPMPDSRMLGLLVFFPGWLIVFTRDPYHLLYIPRRWVRSVFFAGVLFSIAQSLQYTTLYIIFPVLLVYFSYWMVVSYDRASVARLIAACIAGCLTVPILMEVLSAAAGVPLALGPFMTYLERWNAHRALAVLGQPFAIWLQMFNLQFGIPLCFLAILGIGATIFNHMNRYGVDGRRLALLAIVVLLGLLQQFFSNSQAMFRQVSVLLPFLFIFVAIGAATVASLIPGHRWRAVFTVVILVAASIIPVRESITVFEAQLGLGKAMNWAWAVAGPHKVRFLRIGWFSVGYTGIASEPQLRRLAPDDLLVSYYPTDTAGLAGVVEPNLRIKSVLEQVVPLYSRPTLYTTNSMWCEIHSRGNPDYRTMPLMSEARIYRVGDILAHLPVE